MTQIKIYVVHENNYNLDGLKYQLCEIFGGLTKYPNLKGLWINTNNATLVCDIVTVWEIWTNKTIEQINVTSLKAICQSIKQITKQDSQLYTINNDSFFI